MDTNVGTWRTPLGTVPTEAPVVVLLALLGLLRKAVALGVLLISKPWDPIAWLTSRRASISSIVGSLLRRRMRAGGLVVVALAVEAVRAVMLTAAAVVAAAVAMAAAVVAEGMVLAGAS